MESSDAGFSSETETFHSLRSLPPLLPPETAVLSVASYSLSLQLTSHCPEATAIIDSATGQTISYAQFIDQTQNLSNTLRSQFGLSKGDVAFIISLNSIHIPVLYFALLSIGVVISASDPTSIESEISRQIQLLKPVIAFATSATSHKIPSLKNGTILIDSPEFLSMAVNSSPQLPCLDVYQSDIAAIMYSSGTTGKTKGVILTHRNLTAIISNHYYAPRAEREVPEVVMCMTSPLSGFALFCCLKSVAMSETVVVLTSRFDLKNLLRAVEEFRVTSIAAAPFLAVAMTKSELTNGYDLKSLEGFRYTGSPFGLDAINAFTLKFPDVLLTQGYGMTETAGPVCLSVTAEERRRLGSVGRLQPNYEARIKDPQTGTALPPGNPGELWLRGPMIMKGYVGDPEATSEALTDGWLRTGDLCYFDQEGFLFVVDRLKEIIKYKGRQVSPAELEQVLLSHPEVIDAAVIPYPDEEAGQIPMALVVTSPKSNLDEAQIISFVAEQVTPYKKIRRVSFVNSIPRSAGGKILRKELAKIALHPGITGLASSLKPSVNI